MSKLPVVYAEDDRDDAFFLQHAFHKAGISNPLVILNNGQKVIDYLGGVGVYADRVKYPLPCLLLLDLKLPLKSGFDVLEWIREQDLPKLNVVVLSASGQGLDIDLAKKLGAKSYFIKSTSPAKLVEIVRRIQTRWLA